MGKRGISRKEMKERAGQRGGASQQQTPSSNRGNIFPDQDKSAEEPSITNTNLEQRNKSLGKGQKRNPQVKVDLR